MIADFVVVGSGVSGGRIAHDLVSGGASCVLVEAGPALDARTYPESELDASARMFWGGGIELTRDGRVGLLRARCVGGTSVVNQALVDRFDALALDDWRSRSGIEWLSVEGLRPWYEEVERNLSIREVPAAHRNRNAELFAAGMRARGLGYEPLRRAQTDCRHDAGSDCIRCLGGCPRDAKQSTWVTSIRPALARGLRLEPDFEVDQVAVTGGEVVVKGRRCGAEREVRAGQAVLAAGAIGNSALLLRSGYGTRLPALGRGFACHPQAMTFARFDEPVDAHKGPLQAFKSADEGLRRAGYKFENVFAPPIATAMLLAGAGHPLPRIMRAYRHLAGIEVCVRDEATGRIRVDGRGRPRVEKKLTAGDRRRLAQGLGIVEELFKALGAREVLPCPQPFGLHLMGGCALGIDPATSVVGPDFRVHGEPHLWAADSSVFPSAPGINPSLTIMALSAKAAAEMLA